MTTVGLTYDLRDDYLARGFTPEECAEFDAPETIDAIETVLKARGLATKRIGHLHALVRALARDERWDFVFNIAEGLYGPAREAQVPALLDAFGIPYVFSDARVLALALDKALTKRVVRDAGIPTAAFCVIEGSLEFTAALPPFPLFVKPNAEGTGKGITVRSLVRNKEELRQAVADIWARYRQPVLVEAYLPGRELTVGITGTGDAAQIVGVMEILLEDSADACGYTYDNKQHYEERVRYARANDAEAKKAEEMALAAWRVLGCRDGGRVDLRSDATGEPHFLEVNPLAGLHPTLGDLVILARLHGISYAELLGRMLDSALGDPARFPDRALAETALA